MIETRRLKNVVVFFQRMDTTFMNSRNSNTSDPHKLLHNLSDKIDLKRSAKYVALSNLSNYYTQKNIKTLYKNNRFKISAPKWNDNFELPDGSYSVSNIQDYFKYILKRPGEKTDNPLIRIQVNKIVSIESHLKLKLDIISNF